MEPGLSRTREDVARSAFADGDVEQSRLLHDQTAVREGGHCAAPSQAAVSALRGSAVGTAVACGVDVAAPVLSAGAAGPLLRAAALGAAVGLILSVALSLYELAARTQYLAFREREKGRELWELNNFPEGEKREMVDIWRSKGLRERDARALINIMCRYERFFVDIMMTEELGFGPESEEDTPLRSAAWTGGAALAFSCAPWALQALVAPAAAVPARAVLAVLAAEGCLVAWLHSRLFNLATWHAAAYVAAVVAGVAATARLAAAAL